MALLIETSNAYGRGLLQGVVAYIREHEPWSFHLVEQGRGDAPPPWLARWDGDGIIARIENSRIAAAVLKSGLPAVDVSSARHAPSLPWAETDDRAIAQVAADHLLGKGFRHFAFCGDPRFPWSRARGDRFRELVQQAGYKSEAFSPRVERGDRQVAAIAEWLKLLPRPVAVLACYDIRGQQVLDACRSAGLSVPDEIAVLGVDNDELLCELASPPLSSVIPDTHKTGYEAAALLARMLHGERLPPIEVRINPLGVRARQSTDALAIDDPKVVAAVRFIREHACDAINVGDVVRAVAVSRRVLETRFKDCVQHSPHAEIVRVKLERVKDLLVDTDLSLEEIAQRTGFEHPEYLSVMFKREAGETPRDFRVAHRVKPRPA